MSLRACCALAGRTSEELGSCSSDKDRFFTSDDEDDEGADKEGSAVVAIIAGDRILVSAGPGGAEGTRGEGGIPENGHAAISPEMGADRKLRIKSSISIAAPIGFKAYVRIGFRADAVWGLYNIYRWLRFRA